MKEPVIIVGAGLAGLVAAYELAQRKVPCIIVDQENEKNLGGQAFWSLGGIFCVNSSNQRLWRIRDSKELALKDWMSTAGFDREREDFWPRQWAEAFVTFAADEMEQYLKTKGVKFTTVGWAERGGGSASGHGNSVPRFHLTWGTGPEIVRVFAEPVNAAVKAGLIEFRFRHRVDGLVIENDTVVGVQGKILVPTDAERGVATSRETTGDFELRGGAVILASGGIGGDVDLVRKWWPAERLGKAPDYFVVGVPAHVDGRMIEVAMDAGANVVNRDRMWHYTEGLANWDPIWPQHGIRVIPGPSSLWLDATGKRLPAPCFPGCDTLGTLKAICATGYDYSWFILNQAILSKEFSLSGSEQNPDVTGKSLLQLIRSRLLNKGGPVPVQNFGKYGADFIIEDNLEALVEGMNKLAKQRNGPALTLPQIKHEIDMRDAQVDNSYTKDAQIMLIRNARNFIPESFSRVTRLHKLLDPAYGPLVAVRMNIITRKSLGGLETDLSGNVMRPDGKPFRNLYAAGEASGFGGGGVHGYSSLEGTFLGGCIFSGRTAGRAIADLIQIEAGTKSKL